MTDSELQEIKEAINAAKQYSEDKPSGDYERLLIAILPLLQYTTKITGLKNKHNAIIEVSALSIARAINSASLNAL